GALDGAGDDGPPDRVPEAVPPGPAEAGAPRSPDLAALDGLDDDVLRAIATAVADRLGRIVRPEVLPAVVAELARIAEERGGAAVAPGGNGGAVPVRPGAPAPHGGPHRVARLSLTLRRRTGTVRARAAGIR